MTSDSVAIAGNRVTFDRLGKASALLLVRGAFETRYLWRGTAALPAAQHTAISRDLCGIGD
jgi:hypothetical protein